MAYVSDRQRVELLLLPMMAQLIVKRGVDDPEESSSRKAIKLFDNAMGEAVQGLTDRETYKLLRRACRLHQELVKPYQDAQARVDKIGLMLFNLLTWSIDSGYIVLHDNSPMSLGLDMLLPALEEAANITKLDESARKAAGKMLKTLQSEGYFKGVTQ